MAKTVLQIHSEIFHALFMKFKGHTAVRQVHKFKLQRIGLYSSFSFKVRDKIHLSSKIEDFSKTQIISHID